MHLRNPPRCFHTIWTARYSAFSIPFIISAPFNLRDSGSPYYIVYSARHNATAAGANARVVCTGQLFARVKFYSAFIQLECSDRRQGGLAQSLSPVPSEPRFKWMKVTAKPPQLGNWLGFFQEPTVSSSSTLDEIVGLFPFFCQRCYHFSCCILAREWPG